MTPMNDRCVCDNVTRRCQEHSPLSTALKQRVVQMVFVQIVSVAAE